MIEDLTSHMKPMCIGRFVMSVPQDVNFRGNVKLFYGLGKNFKTVNARIESQDATPESMRRQMDAEAREIDEGDKNRKTKKSMLLDYRVINDQMIYLRKHDDLISAKASNHELHVLVEKTQLVLEADSFEGLDPGPDFPIEPFEQVQARLFRIASQIRLTDDPENAGAGFCLGPVVIDSDNDEEEASMGFRMSRYPDFSLGIYSKALTPGSMDKPLLERASAVTDRFDFDVLRKGETSFAGMKAQEWLAKGIDDHDNLILFFRAESMRADPAFVRPLMSIKLQTGGQLVSGPNKGKYVASSLTPREAVALWDAMVQSVRVRPDAVRAVQKAASP
ncbi:MAG TPA: T6SS immunity protein Tli4 family protein [Acidobacteriaceae bacterium]